jgi:16S rRNA processing protein RimM
MPAKRSRQPKTQNSGSPQSEPEFLAVGRLGKPHGVRGDLILQIWTDFPERLQPGAVLLAGDDLQEVELAHVKPHQKNLIVRLAGIKSRESAARFTNLILHIPVEHAMPLPQGEFYHHELVGLTAVGDDGQVLGQISEVLVTGANDVYAVKNDDGRELLLPATEEVILAIDLDAGQVQVHLLPGLLD